MIVSGRNNVKEITNPTFFGYNGLPTPDGLLSNEIFGITQADRAGIFGYIDLVEYFIDPSCYKALLRLDRKFNEIVHGTNFFTINDKTVHNNNQYYIHVQNHFGEVKSFYKKECFITNLKVDIIYAKEDEEFDLIECPMIYLLIQKKK